MTFFNTMDRIDAHVFIGGYLAAANPTNIKKNGITHILKLFPDDDSYIGGFHRHLGVKYLVLDVDDSADYPIDQHFAECLYFIQKAICDGGRILIHCHAGISRSATIVLLHLMINSGLSLAEARDLLKIIRPVIDPNSGFWACLTEIDRRATQFRLEGKVPLRPMLLSCQSTSPSLKMPRAPPIIEDA